MGVLFSDSLSVILNDPKPAAACVTDESVDTPNPSWMRVLFRLILEAGSIISTEGYPSRSSPLTVTNNSRSL